MTDVGKCSESEPFDAYVTKYALTRGIIKVRATTWVDSKEMIKVKPNAATGGFITFYHGNEWHKTLPAAEYFANRMRIKKIESYKKQIKKLESIKFWMGGVKHE